MSNRDSFYRAWDWLAGEVSVRLWVLNWLADPTPETPVDRAIREEGERLRGAFPEVNF